MNRTQIRRMLREASAPGEHTQMQWFKVIERQGSMCFWCGKSLRDQGGKLRATKDHLMPISRGGGNEIENIVAACHRCNAEKNARTAQEYFDFLRARGRKISAICTVPAFTENWLVGRDVSGFARQFLNVMGSHRMPERPPEYWPERRAFLNWQREYVSTQPPKKNPAAALANTEPQTLAVSCGMAIEKRKA